MVKVPMVASGDFIRGKEILGKKPVRVKVLGEGEYMPSKYKKKDGTPKTQLVIPVKMDDVIRKLGLNPTSIKEIALKYTTDTENWINKHLDLEAEKRKIGKDKEIIAIWATPVEEDSITDDDLFPKQNTLKTKEKEEPAEDVNVETQEEVDNWKDI